MSERASLGLYGSERLAARRRSKRRFIFFTLGIFILLVFGGLIWGIRQSNVRIVYVEISGADQSLAPLETSVQAIPDISNASSLTGLADVAFAAMQGTYAGIIPRDSIFFFPASRIRADILAARSDIAAVSISRNGFTGLSIKINDRTPITRWCGLSPTPDVDEYCYIFDASGYIFAAAGTSTQTINSFTLYAPLIPLETSAKAGPGVSGTLSLTGLVGETLEPMRATIAHAEKLPRAFDFARQLNTLGSLVTKVVIRADEVDDYLTSGTLITYVLGHENDAYTALISARANMNLADGSIDYVDLRFDGKVYVKKRNDKVQ